MSGPERLFTIASATLLLSACAHAGHSRDNRHAATDPRGPASSRPGWSPARTEKNPARLADPSSHRNGGSGASRRAVAPKAPAGPVSADVVKQAQAIAKGRRPPGMRRDCSGFVTAAFAATGTPIQIPESISRRSSRISEQLLLLARESRQDVHRAEAPRPGDLAFFRDTFGRLRGNVTHVAMVESVDGDGTVTLLHHLGGRIRRDPMNLDRPGDPRFNGYLRKKQRAGEPHLAGELFVAYARFATP